MKGRFNRIHIVAVIYTLVVGISAFVLILYFLLAYLY